MNIIGAPRNRTYVGYVFMCTVIETVNAKPDIVLQTVIPGRRLKTNYKLAVDAIATSNLNSKIGERIMFTNLYMACLLN